MTQKEIDRISYAIIGAAIKVHKQFGGSMLESLYQKCMTDELRRRGFAVETEKTTKLNFEGALLNSKLRCDMVVNSLVVVELKVASFLTKTDEHQLLTYTRLLRMPKGILINFKCDNIFKHGQKTFVTEFYSQLPPE